jgi:hypothetical protein
VRINIAIPEEHVKKPVLDGALEAVTRLNESLLAAGQTPTDQELIAKGARWQPEPPGQEHFDHGGIIAARGHGDCDDWAPLRAARLRVTGEDPGARAVVRKSGAKRWHATVIRSNGEEDDPSVDAGMGSKSRLQGTRAATLPLMFQPGVHGINGEVGTFINMPQLALRPISDRTGQLEAWESRADLPWHVGPGDSPQDVAMVSLHRSPVSSQAVVGAARGAFRMGLITGADPEQLKRLSALAEACEGASWEEIAADYGEEHANAASVLVGGFFGKALKKLGRVVKKVASPLAKGALSFVPGGGLVTAAYNAASPMLKKSVLKQKHVAPAGRAPALQLLRAAPRAAAPRAAAPPGAPAGSPQWLPYPYPLPYPVPCWGAASNATPGGDQSPGQAWPPRG